MGMTPGIGQKFRKRRWKLCEAGAADKLRNGCACLNYPRSKPSAPDWRRA